MRDYFGTGLPFEHYFRVPRTYARRGIFSIDEPSMTVRGVDRPLPSGYPGHPKDSAPVSTDIRSLTTRERASVQTFPETFEFLGSKTNVNQMIGNAVPVELARRLALVVSEMVSTLR
jgi:DNA (cytosine-5)-methyltransferase 1